MGSGSWLTMRDNGRLGPIEWATAGRPLPGEHVSGDQPIAIGVDEDTALFGVIDGLGHGPEAALAAMRAVDALNGARAKRLEVLLQLCHRVLEGTRGVAMTLARVDFAAASQPTWSPRPQPASTSDPVRVSPGASSATAYRKPGPRRWFRFAPVT
jgi:hypothetical protein